MKPIDYGPRANVAISHVARGHRLHAPALKRAYARLVKADRAKAAIAQWKARHAPKEKEKPKPKEFSEKELTTGPVNTLEQLAAIQDHAATNPEIPRFTKRYQGSVKYKPKNQPGFFDLEEADRYDEEEEDDEGEEYDDEVPF